VLVSLTFIATEVDPSYLILPFIAHHLTIQTMQSPEYRTEIVGNRPTASSSVTSIGPWPIKRANSEVAASIPANEQKDPGLSFSQVMAQVDEVYAITKEMEASEERAINMPVCYFGNMIG
jgi:hypothetical protein